jgi:hypothetical protein
MWNFNSEFFKRLKMTCSQHDSNASSTNTQHSDTVLRIVQSQVVVKAIILLHLYQQRTSSTVRRLAYFCAAGEISEKRGYQKRVEFYVWIVWKLGAAVQEAPRASSKHAATITPWRGAVVLLQLDTISFAQPLIFIDTAISWKVMSLSSKLLLTNSQLTRRIPVAALPQVRSQWYQDEVRSIRDPVTGKWRYEQPRQAIQRFKVVRFSK